MNFCVDTRRRRTRALTQTINEHRHNNNCGCERSSLTIVSNVIRFYKFHEENGIAWLRTECIRWDSILSTLFGSVWPKVIWWNGNKNESWMKTSRWNAGRPRRHHQHRYHRHLCINSMGWGNSTFHDEKFENKILCKRLILACVLLDFLLPSEAF